MGTRGLEHPLSKDEDLDHTTKQAILTSRGARYEGGESRKDSRGGMMCTNYDLGILPSLTPSLRSFPRNYDQSES